MEKVNFRPKALISEVLQIAMHLSECPELGEDFDRAVAADQA